MMTCSGHDHEIRFQDLITKILPNENFRYTVVVCLLADGEVTLSDGGGGERRGGMGGA